MRHDPNPLQAGSPGRVSDAALWQNMKQHQERTGVASLTLPRVAKLHKFGIGATRASLRRLTMRHSVLRRYEVLPDGSHGPYEYRAIGDRP